MNGDAPRPFNANSAISLGLVIIVAGGIWQLSGILNTNKDSAKDSFSELKNLIVTHQAEAKVQQALMTNRLDKIETGLSERWTANDMERWTFKLEKANPAISVPPTRP